jgi:hypothetical protein
MPTPDTGLVSAANLTPQHAQNFMPLICIGTRIMAEPPVSDSWRFIRR